MFISLIPSFLQNAPQVTNNGEVESLFDSDIYAAIQIIITRPNGVSEPIVVKGLEVSNICGEFNARYVVKML